MRFSEGIKRNLSLFFNIPYLPKEFYNEGVGPFLLHISDTPEEIYPYLIKVIKIINPQYIVHTGDIVDNIKLEFFKNQKIAYQKELIKFIKNLEATGVNNIYYTVGNHDDGDLLASIITCGKVLMKDETFLIREILFYASHYYQENRPKANYHLFGHSFEPKNKKERNEILLNGLINMNIIDLSTGKIFNGTYPLGTNRFRKMERGRIGI